MLRYPKRKPKIRSFPESVHAQNLSVFLAKTYGFLTISRPKLYRMKFAFIQGNVPVNDISYVTSVKQFLTWLPSMCR